MDRTVFNFPFLPKNYIRQNGYFNSVRKPKVNKFKDMF